MLWSLCFITEAVGSKWNISCWGNDMARRVRHQSWGMYAKNNPNQREVGFFFIIGKKIIKLLPQLWVEIFAFSLEIQLHLLLCGFCAGTFLIWSCKQSYQMAPVLCTVRACLLLGLMNELLPCMRDLCITTFPTATLDSLNRTVMHGDLWAPLGADHFS